MAEHFIDFAIAWLAFSVLFLAHRAIFGDKQPDPAEDQLQAEYLKAWSEAHRARVRRDTRGQREAMDQVQRLLHKRLQAGR